MIEIVGWDVGNVKYFSQVPVFTPAVTVQLIPAGELVIVPLPFPSTVPILTVTQFDAYRKQPSTGGRIGSADAPPTAARATRPAHRLRIRRTRPVTDRSYAALVTASTIQLVGRIGGCLSARLIDEGRQREIPRGCCPWRWPWALPMKVTVVSPLELGRVELERRREIQLSSAELENPFLSHEFVLAFARARDDVGCAVLEDDNRIVGFVPFERGRGGIGRAAGVGLTDCQGLICVPGLDVDARWLVRSCGLVVLEFDRLLGSQPAFAAYQRTR